MRGIALTFLAVAVLTFAGLLLGSPYALLWGLWFLCAVAIYWVLRLAVRQGVNDALRANRHWLARD